MVIYARDIMRSNTGAVQQNLTVRQAAKMMSNDLCGCLIINSENGGSGIVTEWDIVNKVVAKGLDPDQVLVSEIMTPNLEWTGPRTPTERVAEIMFEKNIRRLPVVENGKILGVITSKDIVRIFRDYMENISAVVSKFGQFQPEYITENQNEIP